MLFGRFVQLSATGFFRRFAISAGVFITLHRSVVIFAKEEMKKLCTFSFQFVHKEPFLFIFEQKHKKHGSIFVK